MFDAKNFRTIDLVRIYNSIVVDAPVKKFANRATAERRVNKLIKDKGIAALRNVLASDGISEQLKVGLEGFFENKKTRRNDGKYQRKNPVFQDDDQRDEYVQNRYRAKTEKFPGKKSQFAKKILTLKNAMMNCPFRQGTVVENSFLIISNNNGIVYEDFRLAGGRNTDLKAMVDKGIVLAT